MRGLVSYFGVGDYQPNRYEMPADNQDAGPAGLLVRSEGLSTQTEVAPFDRLANQGLIVRAFILHLPALQKVVATSCVTVRCLVRRAARPYART
jgi:hypothetical protein